MNGYNKRAADIASSVRESGGYFAYIHKGDTEIRIFIHERGNDQSRGAMFATNGNERDKVIVTMTETAPDKCFRIGRIMDAFLCGALGKYKDVVEALSVDKGNMFIASASNKLEAYGFKIITM